MISQVVTRMNVGPWKEDGYDFLSGLKPSDRLHPIITLVVYWGVDEWTGPRKLSDMLDYVPEEARHAVADYEINLLEPCKIKDFSGFRTGLGPVLRLLSVGGDKEEVKRLCNEQKEVYENLGRKDAEMLEVFMNKKFKREEREEGTVNVFKGIQDWMDEMREEGREEGCDKLASMIRYLMLNGRNEDVIRATEDKNYRNQLFAEYADLSPAN